MLRLIHTADWQIGREYGQFAPDDAAAMAAARLAAVGKIGAIATELQANAIVVAGDVFDAPSIADKTIRRLFAALESFSGPWILIPGNHDAALSAGVWERAGELGCVAGHVHVLTKPGVVNEPALETAFLAAPLAQRNCFSDLTHSFDEMQSEPGYYRIGVAHGSVTGLLQDDLETGNPISPDRVDLARLDYLALGDWHGMKQVNSRMWYSGTPEQDRFRANDPGYVLEVFFEQPGSVPEVRPHRVSQYQWHDVEVVLQGDTAIDALTHQMQAYTEHDVVRLSLSGSVTLAQRRELDNLAGSLEARLGAFRCDLTALSLSASDQDIAQLKADGYLAEVLDDLRADHCTLPEPVRQEALRLFADTLTMTDASSSGSAAL